MRELELPTPSIPIGSRFIRTRSPGLKIGKHGNFMSSVPKMIFLRLIIQIVASLAS